MSAITLRLATLNVWAVPFGIAKHVPERMAAIGRRLGELELDVAALQEVWTEDARAMLVDAGRNAGFGHVWHRPGARNGSGLLLLSRLPFGKPDFRPYVQAGLPQRIHHGDYWGGKGFVLARVQTPAGPLTVLNTHLHAQYTPDPVDEYRGVRTAQAIQLAAAVGDVDDPIVALGDFNVRAGNPDHGVLMGLTGFDDVALRLDNPQDTILGNHPYRGAGHDGGERIDYAFTRTGRHADAIPIAIDRAFDEKFSIGDEDATFSDHAGLRVEVELRPEPARQLPAADPDALLRGRALLRQGRAEAERRRGIERSLALGSAALAVAAIPGAVQLRASRRHFLASVLSGIGVAAIPGAGVAALLSEVAVPNELEAYDQIEALLETFVPAA